MKLLTNKDLFNLVNELSLRYFDKPFKHEAKFNYRLRTTGGRYIPMKKVIEINPKYMVELEEEFIGIIKHELCHYHLHIEGRGYKHGDKEFKELLTATGSPRFCKPLPSNQKKYNYSYVCMECKSEYKRIRRVNTDKLRCGKCKGVIELN
ncbi:MAG TPA: SprT family protein [Virgibacillus sp.]|nr:SprT family protein [Virgibacillus sp.]